MEPRHLRDARAVSRHRLDGVGVTWPLVLACVSLALATAMLRRSPADAALAHALPGAGTRPGYVTSGACQACHPSEYASWHRSFHRTMTQVATPATVLAPFDGRTLESRGYRWRFFERGGELWVEMPDPEWFAQPPWLMQALDDAWPERPPILHARVVMSTGSHHMQTYWVRRPEDAQLAPDDGSLLQVPWVWLIEEERWVPNQDSFLTPPTESPGGGSRWNDNCSQCHSVATEPGVMGPSARFDTRTVELGIACEACHGPAERHVAHYRSPVRRYLRRLQVARGDDSADSTIVNPAKLGAERSNEVCGQCHSFGEWRDAQSYQRSGHEFVPGRVLSEHRIIETSDLQPQEPVPVALGEAVAETRFWPDGTSRVAGREYNAVLASTHDGNSGLTCLSCHSLHAYADVDAQLTPGADGKGACLGCHSEYSDGLEEHTHHESASPGSECMGCHMPRTTYGLFTAMRSHRIDSPDLANSLSSGRPNACSLCHLDRSPAWVDGYLQEWYGAPPAELGLEERTVSAAALWILRGDAGTRALAAWHLGWPPARQAAGERWMLPFLAQLLNDPYAAVRQVAYGSLARLPGYGDLRYDFAGTPSQRAAAAGEALRRWQASGGPTRPRPETLVLEGGRLDGPAWRHLLAQRDSRPVRIRE